jgi:hypothetical protein
MVRGGTRQPEIGVNDFNVCFEPTEAEGVLFERVL